LTLLKLFAQAGDGQSHIFEPLLLDPARLTQRFGHTRTEALKVAAKLIAKGLGCLALLVGAVVKLRFDEGPQRLPAGIGFRSHLRHVAVQLGRDTGSSFVDELDARIEPLAEPADLSLNAVPQATNGGHCELLKAFQRLIEFLAQATNLVFDGAAHDIGFRSQELGSSLGGQ
jgi:hypothetical protein